MSNDSHTNDKQPSGLLPRIAQAWRWSCKVAQPIGAAVDVFDAFLTKIIRLGAKVTLVGGMAGSAYLSVTAQLSPVPPPSQTKEVKPPVTTGSIPEPRTVPTPDPGRRGRCFSENAAEMMNAVAGDEDPPAKFKLRFAGQRLCAVWTLRVWSVAELTDGSWRMSLYAPGAFFGVVIVAVVRADPKVGEGQLVRVEGTVDRRDPPTFMRLWGAVHISNARISTN